MTGMVSKRSGKVSGGASVSRRDHKIPGGGRFGEKTMIIIRKETEKKIEKAIKKVSKELSDDQSKHVSKLIKQQIDVVVKEYRQTTGELSN